MRRQIFQLRRKWNVECELIETLLVHNFIDVCRHRYIYDIRVPCVKEHDRRVHHQISHRTYLRWAAKSTCIRASRDRFALVRHVAMALVTSMSFGLSAAGYLGHRRAAQFARDIELYLCWPHAPRGKALVVDKRKVVDACDSSTTTHVS